MLAAPSPGFRQLVSERRLSGERLALPCLAVLHVESGRMQLRHSRGTVEAQAGEFALVPGDLVFDVTVQPGARGVRLDQLMVDDGMHQRAQGLISALSSPVARRMLPEITIVGQSPHLRAAWRCLVLGAHSGLHAWLIEQYGLAVLLQLAIDGVELPSPPDRDLSLRDQVATLVLSDPFRFQTAEQIASRLGMSSQTLRRRLAEGGQRFRSILEDARMNRALELVTGTDQPFGRIAAEVGYHCASRFSARFRQRFGVTPRLLRRSGQTRLA
ncbi:MAG: helix-turn-helix transcriptional regulator [Xanthomonadales bacterium]|nr:helix-turn-helix transcriptional regulator [Xanthomonadales bacterium]